MLQLLKLQDVWICFPSAVWIKAADSPSVCGIFRNPGRGEHGLYVILPWRSRKCKEKKSWLRKNNFKKCVDREIYIYFALTMYLQYMNSVRRLGVLLALCRSSPHHLCARHCGRITLALSSLAIYQTSNRLIALQHTRWAKLSPKMLEVWIV